MSVIGFKSNEEVSDLRSIGVAVNGDANSSDSSIEKLCSGVGGGNDKSSKEFLGSKIVRSASSGLEGSCCCAV